MPAREVPADRGANGWNVNRELAEVVGEWKRLFNRGEYFEAHEVAEHLWLRAAEPEKTFLKGLIHAAVALCHYQRGNGHGARVKYASCRRYLEPYRPDYQGVDLEDLLAEMDRFFAALAASPRGTPPPPPLLPWPAARAILPRHSGGLGGG